LISGNLFEDIKLCGTNIYTVITLQWISEPWKNQTGSWHEHLHLF